MSRRLIVGLGNPGRKYEGTRHNVGFGAVDLLAQRFRIDLSRTKFDALYATGEVAGESVVLLKPQTFMNRSGKSVQAAQAFYGVSAEETVVLHDDLDLDLGQIKIKGGGGHGGHNGLRDIVAKTGSREFLRIRLGIGRPEHGDVTNFVLGRFDGGEQSAAEDLLWDGADAVEILLREGLEAAQQRFHSR